MIELRDSGLRTEGGQNAVGYPQAWKKLIGDKPVDARLATLPENKIRRSAFAISSSVQLVLALTLVSLPLLFPESLSVHMTYQVTPLAAPLTEVPVHAEEPVERPKSKPLPAKPIDPVHVAKLMAPQPLIAPKTKVLERLNMDAPKLQSVLAPTKLDTPMAEPERPREPVKTGVLGTSSAQPTLKAALEKVQTGGFGDPNGFASDTPEARHGNVARLGSFELPVGPGYGNGTGGANGARGTVASAGFGSGVATTAAARGPHGAVQSSSFGSVTIVPEIKSTPRQAEGTAAIQPVEILEKPKPVYSDEARKLGIEGEVLVEVIFRASGQVDTARVVKGLGHGLDESALRAARQIRFKPALQSGHAVDFPAIAHIVFQLAF